MQIYTLTHIHVTLVENWNSGMTLRTTTKQKKKTSLIHKRSSNLK